jgi:hypothetical protein
MTPVKLKRRVQVSVATLGVLSGFWGPTACIDSPWKCRETRNMPRGTFPVTRVEARDIMGSRSPIELEDGMLTINDNTVHLDYVAEGETNHVEFTVTDKR